MALATTATAAAAETATKETVAHVARDTAWSAFEWGMIIGGGTIGIAIGIIACTIKCCADA